MLPNYFVVPVGVFPLIKHEISILTASKISRNGEMGKSKVRVYERFLGDSSSASDAFICESHRDLVDNRTYSC